MAGHLLSGLDLYFEFFIQCMLSLLMAGIIGYERELRAKPAGLKTHVLIGLGSTALTFLSIQMSFDGDPGRIAAQVVSGIGFIGAGTILHANRAIQGLTTAASLWVVAAIGMLIGAGMIVPAWLLTCVVFVFLIVSRLVTPNKYDMSHYALSIEISAVQALSKIEAMLHTFDIAIETKLLKRDKKIYLSLSYAATPLTQHLFLKRLFSLPGIGEILKS